MCGITGVVDPTGRLVDPGLVGDMTDRLAHRGPDHGETWEDASAVLGHRRLSVLDPRPRGNQPMAGWGRVVTYNGEIYNFRDLRDELEEGGYSFDTETDTEVVLAAWDAWGLDALERFEGFFAFGLWDPDADRLVLARDRLGQKPLWYTRLDGGGIAFASGLKPLLLLPDLDRTVDEEALAFYLALGYVPAPWTILESVRKLPPAHRLVWEDGEVRTTRYWDLRHDDGLQDSLGPKIRRSLSSAVERRLVSDVPLGAFLSGGIDSAAVVWSMAEHLDEPPKTFTVGFADAAFDERDKARRVAEAFGTDHRETVVEPDAVDLLPTLVWHHDEPFADSSALPTYHVAEFARRHVTVALNGDGGDEAFGGYDRYYLDLPMRVLDRLPEPVLQALRGLADRLPTPADNKHPLALGQRALRVAGKPEHRRYLQIFPFFAGRDDSRTDPGEDPVEGWFRDRYVGDDPVTRKIACDYRAYLPGDLLVKADRATMAHGLEGRSPFLDHRLVETAARISSRRKVQGTRTKVALKEALADVLPREILRQRKRGFGVPLSRWLREDELGEVAEQVLTSERLADRKLLRMGRVRRLLDRHRQGREDHAQRIWALLWLEVWFRTFVDGEGDAAKEPIAGWA